MSETTTKPKTVQQYINDVFAIATGEKAPTVKTENAIATSSILAFAGVGLGLLAVWGIIRYFTNPK